MFLTYSTKQEISKEIDYLNNINDKLDPIKCIEHIYYK